MRSPHQYFHKWDVFLSYATEDKDLVAKPIAERLRQLGIKVWFDEFELRVGDSLTHAINRGLAASSYGVVILSPRFLKKKWPRKELAALVALDEPESRRILPIWHELGPSEIKESLPMLADVVAVDFSRGITVVINSLLAAMNLPFSGEALSGMWAGETGRLRLFPVQPGFRGDYDWQGHAWAGHVEGSLTEVTNADYKYKLFTFQWRWDLSPEQGNGFFVVSMAPPSQFALAESYSWMGGTLESMLGAWAPDHEKFDFSLPVSQLLDTAEHKWSFRREPGLDYNTARPG